MEKEQILSELTTRLGQTSLSSQTLMKYVELNPVAEGVEPDDAYYSKATSFLQGMQGQYNHDVATQVESFKKNYKPQQSSPDSREGAGDNVLADKLKEMENEILLLKEEREAEKNAASIHDLKIQSMDLLKSQIENGGKNICNDEILNIAISDVKITKDMEVEEIVSCAKRNYEKRYKAIFGNGASPSINQYAETGEEQAKSRREAFKDRLRAQGKLPRKQ
jgi:hypothetical protein